MREDGATFQAIGEALGVSPSGANVIYQCALEVQAEEATGMGVRAIRILWHYRGDLHELAPSPRETLVARARC
ncbi:hypothetical protein HNP52_004584 [Sphingomonas kyeonggiensis]|uniref:Uncharacterized protein n=1 Tax=Sphingomonas kyeonggiensis TaxID=1268553 RepID=A0A7W7K6U8_9SPHN|nr:hypothetical protein [Sphingomonas kyeonggiensis]MBB4841480.1 hypothetical protein [Sphingomonas kyeonggiensis]